MKVCFISFFEKGYGGGAGRVGHELAEHFARSHNTALICPAGGTGLSEGESGLAVFGVASAGEGDIKIPRLSTRTVRRIFAFLDEFQPRVVHAHEPALLGLIGQLWAKMNAAYFVHTSHILPQKVFDFGVVEVSGLGLLETQFGEKITDQVLADFYENCDAIIALNEPARKSLRDFGYQGKIFVIPNGRDLEMYEECEVADIDEEEKILTYIGHLTNRKNQLYLLRVLRCLPENYRLNLIGKALNSSYERKLTDYIEENELANVHFTGQVPYSEIPRWLEKAHLFVSASKMEVQSLVIIEALASATPVVGLSNETVDELVTPEVGEALPAAASPQEFATAVEELCNVSTDEYCAMCKSARQRVSHLNWPHVVDLTADAYQELFKGQPAAVTKEKGIKLDNLISILPPGKLRDHLTDKLQKLKQKTPSSSKITQKWKSIKKVPRSTWLLAAFTIAVSWLGYMIMKHLYRKHDN